MAADRTIATDRLLGDLSARACPVCGSTDDRDVFAAQRLDTASLDTFAFASRNVHAGARAAPQRCPDRSGALDIGTGEGAFLSS